MVKAWSTQAYKNYKIYKEYELEKQTCAMDIEMFYATGKKTFQLWFHQQRSSLRLYPVWSIEIHSSGT